MNISEGGMMHGSYRRPWALAALTLVFSFCGGLHRSGADVIPAAGRIAWNAGVPGGIPNRTTVWCDVTKAIPGLSLKAIADGVADDRAAIQAAIDRCPAGQVVYLPAGNYRITSGQIVISRGVTVRGAGMGKTKINVDSNNDSAAFLVQPPTPYLTNQTQITAGAAKGSTSITLANAVGGYPSPTLSPGVPFIIQQANDPALVAVNGCTWCGDNQWRYVQAQMVVTTEASGGSKTVKFQPPLYWDTTATAVVYPLRSDDGVVAKAGIEDLSIDHLNYHGGGAYSVMFKSSDSCWAKNIEIKKSPKSSIKFTDSLRCEVRGCYVHDAWNTEGGSAYGYHIFGFNSAHLIEDNIGENLRHTFVLEGGGSGCVIAYNYSRGAQTSSSPGWVHNDIITHGAHPFLNLYEGNFAHKWVEDWVHGSASHNTGFRNCLTAGMEPDSQGGGYEDTNGVHHPYTNAFWAAGTGNFNYYMNAVGNILGWATMVGGPYEYEFTQSNPSWGNSIYKLGYADEGDVVQSDPKAAATFYRHGNFDYVTNGVKWDPDNSDHSLPDSLYLSGKPAFFGSMHWPPFGPDQTPMISKLPAQVRWESIKAASAARPTAPKNLRIVK